MISLITLGFIFTVGPAVIWAQTCSPDLQCWSPCFENPTFAAGQEKEFATLYKIIQGVRGAQKAFDTKETTFLFDASATDADVRILQRNLASIVALIQQPITSSCNSYFALQYTGNFIFTLFFNIFGAGGWQCLNPCQAANVFQTFGYVSQSTPPLNGDLVGLGCALGNFLNTLPMTCQTNNKRLVIAFENSDVSPVLLNQCFAYDAGVVIKLSGDLNGPPLMRYLTGMGSNADVIELDADVYGANTALAGASDDLLSCIRACCGCPASGRKKREVDGIEQELNVEFDRREGEEFAYYINATTGACKTCKQVFHIAKTAASNIPSLIKENARKKPVDFDPDLASVRYPPRKATGIEYQTVKD